jgi:hypothetical protein
MRKILTLSLLIVAVASLAIFWVVKFKRMVPMGKPSNATEYLMQNVAEIDKEVIRSVYMVKNVPAGRHATGLLVSSGLIVTDAGIVGDGRIAELAVLSSTGASVPISGVEVERDLGTAFLTPRERLRGGLDLDEAGGTGPGEQVYGWGFASGFDPPQPLMSMGYVAGFQVTPGSASYGGGRLVLNGGFDSGGAGGPLFRWRDNQLVGLVVARPVGVDPYLERALSALAASKPGEPVSLMDEHGRSVTLTQEQLVAGLLRRFSERDVAVVMEAVPASLLKERIAQTR